MYAIGHRNGTGGVFSDWYIDERDIPTLDEALEKRRKFRQDNPEHQGWYADVAVIDNNGYGDPLPEGYDGN